MLYTICYKSFANQITDEQVLEIVQWSRTYNAKHKITGILLYIGDSFMQVLEGEKEPVLDLYKKIANDPRHSGVKKLVEGPIIERAFPNWSMGYKAFTAEDLEDLKKINHDPDFSLEERLFSTQLPSSYALELLKSFYDEERLDFSNFWRT